MFNASQLGSKRHTYVSLVLCGALVYLPYEIKVLVVEGKGHKSNYSFRFLSATVLSFPEMFGSGYDNNF